MSTALTGMSVGVAASAAKEQDDETKPTPHGEAEVAWSRAAELVGGLL